MYLIYWKWKVGKAVSSLCDFYRLSYDICDDNDPIDSYDKYEYIIPSPGIPGTHPIYQSWKILSELDFAYQFLPEKFEIISITGTDGKSTTAWIMYNILHNEFSVKKGVYLSGNFDIPFSETILDISKKWEKEGIIVVEVSSFMAFGIKKYESDYSIFTNFKPDHLNWHRDLQEYLDAKMQLMIRTTKKSIINQQVLDFAQESGLSLDSSIKMRTFGKINALKDRTDGEGIIIDSQTKYRLSETFFSGIHNAMNILSCVLVTDEMNMDITKVSKYLGHIKWLPHRLEIIAQTDEITVVEDSKSTSSQSLAAALGSFGTTKNLLLIVGGSDKWDSFEQLGSLFDARVRAVVCIGATKDQFVSLAKTVGIPYLATDSLSDGARWLYTKRQKNDVLMLSPGCASFWLFRDYLDRANQFREVIKNLLK